MRAVHGSLLALALATAATAAAGQAPVAAIAPALGESRSELLFVPLTPCRIIDTRVAGGRIGAGEARDFAVAGTAGFAAQGGNDGGCGVPQGASTPLAAAVMLNLVAVEPLGAGHLLAWQYGEPEPLASAINYQALSPRLDVANGLVVPVAGVATQPFDISLRAGVSAVHLVADVVGYFGRFPLETWSTTSKTAVTTTEGGTVDLSAGLCAEISSCTLAAAAPGIAVIRLWAQVEINHGTNVGGDRLAIGVKNADPTLCTNNDQSINSTDFEVPDSLPADAGVETTLYHQRTFTQSTGTQTYYANGRMILGAGTGDRIESARMICTFFPD